MYDANINEAIACIKELQKKKETPLGMPAKVKACKRNACLTNNTKNEKKRFRKGIL